MSPALYVVYAGAALTGIMIAEAFYLLYAGSKDRRTAINRRMKLQEAKISQEQVLIQLRKERGLDGRSFLFSLDRYRTLRTQSGLTMPIARFLMITSGVALAMVCVAFMYGLPLPIGLAIFPVLCLIIPIKVLKFQRNRRHKIFGVQLPEALELITRSLKAGHPGARRHRHGFARNARSDRHRVRRRRRRSDLRLGSRFGAPQPL